MKVTGRKTLWEGRFLKVLDISYLDRGGVERSWEAIGRTNCDGVVIIVPVTTEGDFLLIKQYRPVLDSYVIEFPAGLVENGEQYIEAASRELVEETGYCSKHIVDLYTGAVCTGINSEFWKVVLALDAKEADQRTKALHPADETEDIETLQVPARQRYERLEEFAGNGLIVDIKIYGLMELALRKTGGK